MEVNFLTKIRVCHIDQGFSIIIIIIEINNNDDEMKNAKNALNPAVFENTHLLT